MKKLLLFLTTLAIVSCTSQEDYTYEQYKAAQYNAAFVKEFGTIDPNHTWGFGTVNVDTRAASSWTNNHNCDWIDELNVILPEGAEEMASPGWLSTGVYIIPTDGSVSLGWTNFNEGDKIYILGNVTELKEANYNGVVTFYNLGTLTYSISSGSRHTIINTGTLTINSYGNVGKVYNSGTLNLVKTYNPWYEDPNAKADIPNEMSIFSTGEGSVLMPDGGDFKAAADIHGTLVCDGNTKIQNDETQYICGVKVDGVLDMTAGHLQASNIEADEITFDGAEIWLTKGGHIKADIIRMPNSATTIYGESSSTALIEVGDIYFQNTNNFDDSFSANIYFRITGAIDFSNSTKFGGGAKHYDDVTAYNADNTILKGYNVSDSASGSPECGEAWTVGTDEIKEQGRVFCEDLGSIGDFDFNDVVFDAKIYKSGKVEITLLAAGGILPISVAGVDVHTYLGEGMVNTGAGPTSDPYTFTTSGFATINDIPVVVSQSVNAGYSTDILLKAEEGKAPQKICVPVGTKWMKEYQKINLGYKWFEEWVRGNKTREETFKNDAQIDSEYLY